MAKSKNQLRKELARARRTTKNLAGYANHLESHLEEFRLIIESYLGDLDKVRKEFNYAGLVAAMAEVHEAQEIEELEKMVNELPEHNHVQALEIVPCRAIARIN